MEAYNNALKEYKDPEKRLLNTTLEETAARVAWSVVKHKYEKDKKGKWIEKVA